MQKRTGNAQQEKEGVDGRHFLARQDHDGQKHKTNKGQEGGDAVKRHEFTFQEILIFEKDYSLIPGSKEPGPGLLL